MKKIQLLFICLLTCLLAGCERHEQSFQGYIEGYYTYVAPAIAGKLEKLEVFRGAQIKENQLLFALDQQPEAAQLLAAQKQLVQAKNILANYEKGQRQTVLEGIKAQQKQAQALLTLNSKTLMRYRTLFKQGFITKEELDTAISNYRQSLNQVQEINANLAEAKLGAREDEIKAQQAAVKTAQDQVKQATWALQQKTKYAPVSGLVFDTYYRIGEFVPAGQPVVSLLAPTNIRLIFYVPEPILSKITMGQKILFTCDGCKQKTPATIRFISSEAEYTPPVIFSKDRREQLVYRIEAKLTPEIAVKFHTGQPVDVYLK